MTTYLTTILKGIKELNKANVKIKQRLDEIMQREETPEANYVVGFKIGTAAKLCKAWEDKPSGKDIQWDYQDIPFVWIIENATSIREGTTSLGQNPDIYTEEEWLWERLIQNKEQITALNKTVNN